MLIMWSGSKAYEGIEGTTWNEEKIKIYRNNTNGKTKLILGEKSTARKS